MRKKTSIIKLMVVPIICLCFVLTLGLPAKADSDQPLSGDSVTQLSKKKETLQKKSSNMVSTYAGKKYAINSDTLIVGKDGRQVKIDYLLVPCEAELIYETRADGKDFVHRIKVLSTHNGATNRMWDPPR